MLRNQARNALAISQVLSRVLISCTAFRSRLCKGMYPAVYVWLCIQPGDSVLLTHNPAIVSSLQCVTFHCMKALVHVSVCRCCLHGYTGRLHAGKLFATAQEAGAHERKSRAWGCTRVVLGAAQQSCLGLHKSRAWGCTRV